MYGKTETSDLRNKDSAVGGVHDSICRHMEKETASSPDLHLRERHVKRWYHGMEIRACAVTDLRMDTASRKRR